MTKVTFSKMTKRKCNVKLYAEWDKKTFLAVDYDHPSQGNIFCIKDIDTNLEGKEYEKYVTPFSKERKANLRGGYFSVVGVKSKYVVKGLGALRKSEPNALYVDICEDKISKRYNIPIIERPKTRWERRALKRDTLKAGLLGIAGGCNGR